MNWVIEDLGKRIEEIERATPFTPASGGQWVIQGWSQIAILV
jgi:hypothetical protein